MTATGDAAEARLTCDLGRAGACVSRLVAVKISQNQFDALADFVFNLGCGSLEHTAAGCECRQL